MENLPKLKVSSNGNLAQFERFIKWKLFPSLKCYQMETLPNLNVTSNGNFAQVESFIKCKIFPSWQFHQMETFPKFERLSNENLAQFETFIKRKPCPRWKHVPQRRRVGASHGVALRRVSRRRLLPLPGPVCAAVPFRGRCCELAQGGLPPPLRHQQVIHFSWWFHL